MDTAEDRRNLFLPYVSLSKERAFLGVNFKCFFFEVNNPFLFLSLSLLKKES